MSSAKLPHPYADFVHRVREARALPGRRVRRASQGLGARSTRARLPRVPRRLRHRDEPPRLQDPLQDPERRPAHARRALLRAVDRHGGASSARASCRSSSLESARPLADFDVVGFSLQFELTYTNILTMLDLGGIPLRSARSRRGRSARHRGRSDGDAPRAARGVHRRLRASATARSARPRSRSSWTTLEEQGRAARERLVALAKLARRLRAVALRDASSMPTPASRSSTAPASRGSPLPGASAASSTTSTSSRSPTTARSAGPRPSSIACRSRSRAAAPRAAASARPGMIYRPVRERDPEQIVETVASRREEERLRRGEPHVALDRRLLVHRAAHQEGHRARSRPRSVSLGVSLAARLRPRARRCSTTSAACARAASRSRPRPAASACATW